MGNSIPPLENPTPPRDLRLLAYVLRPGKEVDFIEYHKKTIKEYLKEEGVKDVVAWSIKLGNQILLVFATSPTIPPWFGAPKLVQLGEFVEDKFPENFEFERRRDLDIHFPEDVNDQ